VEKWFLYTIGSIIRLRTFHNGASCSERMAAHSNAANAFAKKRKLLHGSCSSLVPWPHATRTLFSGSLSKAWTFIGRAFHTT
jgi:hypothetical protein